MQAVKDTFVQPGSRWRLRRGEHRGTIIEITDLSAGNNVRFRTIKGGRSVGSSSEDDKGKLHTVRQDNFFYLYEPVTQTAATGAANGVVTQPRFKQHNVKKAPIEGGEPLAAAQGLAVELMTITPNLAASWLERGGVNRHLSQPRVEKLVAAIRRGEWQITGDTIKLDNDGKIRDGQHRLEAIYRSGVTVQTLVVRGVQEKAFDVMDTGRSRSLSDVLSIHGYKSIYGLQAAIRNLMVLEQTGRIIESSRESREVVTTASGLEYAQAHPEIEEGVRLGDTIRLVMSGGHGLWGAMMVLFLRIDREATLEFQDKLVNGEGLSRGNPILVLRNRLLADLRQFITRDAREKEILAGTIIHAWNLYRRGETVDSWAKLQWRAGKDPFPLPE